MAINPKRWRKLKRGEHRYITKSGRVRIIKPKRYDKWIQNKTYNKKLRVFEFKVLPVDKEKIKKEMLALFENKALPRYEYYTDEKGNKRKRLVGIKGYDNMHFKPEMDRLLEKAPVNDEGNGWFQINAYTGNTAKAAPIKIRYNPKQKLLEVWIRDYKL